MAFPDGNERFVERFFEDLRERGLLCESDCEGFFSERDVSSEWCLRE